MTEHAGNTNPPNTVLRAATAIWIAASTVNFIIWLLVSVVSGEIDRPWFLWAFAGGGVAVGALRIGSRLPAKETA